MFTNGNSIGSRTKTTQEIARVLVVILDFLLKLTVFIKRQQWNNIISWTQRFPQWMFFMKNELSIFQVEPFENKPELLKVDTILIRLGAASTLLDFRLRRTPTKQKPAQGIA